MPAQTSSRIAPALGHLLAVVEPFAGDRVGLLAVLAQIPDPRKARGIRHQFSAVLALAVCAVLAGARSYVAIGEWAGDADALTLSEVGAGAVVPCETTFRRTLQSLDADLLDERLGAWASERTRPAPGSRRRIGVDGKTLRGSACDAQPGRHLLAALDHAHGVVLGQVDVQAKTNEIPLFSKLLDRIELTDAIVTADAIHAQRAHAEYLVEQRDAHFVLAVKRNQPHLYDQMKALPWRQIPAGYDARERGHGRDEWRTVKVTAVAAGLDFPHAAQAIRVIRRRKPITAGRGTNKRWSTETVYAITSLAAHQIAPQELADVLRGHWLIEDRLHWVRDVTYDEDRSQVRTANGPRVMASLRNVAITVLRLSGILNIAAATRHHARRPERPLQTIKNC
jgi:predicted transposase YbfD/YdcC